MNKVRIKDVAIKAGVSPSTVSRVLNAHPRAEEISLKTRQKIWEAAKELGYTPNIMGKYLRLGLKFPCVGLEFSKGFDRLVNESFFWVIASNISALLGAEGIQVVHLDASHIHSLNVGNGAALRYLLQVVVVLDKIEEEIELLRELGVPLICIFPYREIPKDTICIDTNDEKGIVDGLEYLWKLGHRNIVFVSGKSRGKEYPAFERRRLAFRKIAENMGFSSAEEVFVEEWSAITRDGKPHPVEENKVAKALSEATAIFAANDYIAYWVIRFLNTKGIFVPVDKSVMGFDDLYFSRLFNPPLTTVAIPLREISELVANTCLGIMKNEEGISVIDNPVQIFEVKFVERSSCATVPIKGVNPTCAISVRN